MPSYSRGSIVLVRYPFSDLTNSKIRPAVVVGTSHPSQDVLIVPVTSRVDRLQSGEFVMDDWQAAGLNVASAIKRGIFTIHQDLLIKRVGTVSVKDLEKLEQSLLSWLGLSK